MSMNNNLRLLDDKQLGLLMEIAFSTKPKPPDNNLEYFSLYLRKDEQYGITTFSELKNLYIEGHNSSDFFTLKTSQGLTAARKLQEVANGLENQIKKIRKQVSEQALRPTMSMSEMEVNRLLAPEIKKLQQANSLSESFRDSYKKGEGLNNRDLVRLLMFPEVLNELFDEVSVSKQQISNLRSFLKVYIEQYSERKLLGQGEIENVWFLAERWMNALNSDEYIKKYSAEKVPLRVGTNAEYFCHSILYLDYIKKIKLWSIALRPAKEKTIEGKEIWMRWEGTSKYVMQWCAIVDNLSIENSTVSVANGSTLSKQVEAETASIDNDIKNISRKGLEKKWDALQAIWTYYEASSRADAVMVPVAALTVKSRTTEETDEVIEGLRSTGCFMGWDRKDRHYSINGINHPKLVSMFDETKAIYQKLAEEYELSRNPTPTNNKLPTKREMAKEVTKLTKICRLGKKEAKLLKILSNFEPKRTKELTNEIPTKDYKHLKKALDKKIRSEGWTIRTDKGKGLNPDSFYVLVKTTPVVD